MMKKGMLLNIFITLTIMIHLNIVSAEAVSLIESNGTAAENIDGKMLLSLGRQLNKPMITLFGMAIRNLEHLQPCDEWTEWSVCGAAKRGYIATRKRSRTCETKQLSQESEKKRTETDISICEGHCPDDYNLTTNGFCVKLYSTPKTFDEAEKQCQKDGGHVVNIDSEVKQRDVVNVLKGSCCYVYIDGRRKDASSPYVALNGSKKQYFNWASGEPNTDSYQCIEMHPSNTYWYDYPCTGSTLRFVCEIVQ